MAVEFIDLQHSAAQIDQSIDTIASHVANNVIHITAAERAAWDAKASAGDILDLQTQINAKASASDLSAEILARQTEDSKHSAALVDLIDNSAKNVFGVLQRVGTSNSNAQASYTIGGVKFTVNSDATITIERVSSGSSTQAVWCYDASGAILLDDFCDGNYIFSSGLDGNSKVRFRLAKLDGGSYIYVNSYAAIPQSSETGINVSVSVDSDFTGTITCKPMVCLKAAWDISQKFVPYCPPLPELYAMIQAMQT